MAHLQTSQFGQPRSTGGLRGPCVLGLSMGRLTATERAAIGRRLKEMKVRIANPRLTIEQQELLRSQRAALQKQIMNDRNGL